MVGPFRQSIATCETCGSEAAGRCPRCGRVFCKRHDLVTEYRRCGACEKEYASRRRKIGAAPLAPFAVTVTTLGAVLWLISGVVDTTFVVLFLAGTLLAGAIAAISIGRGGVASGRADFLAEGDGRRKPDWAPS